MFKRTLGILTLFGLLNILLCYQQKKHAERADGVVYAQSSESLIGYIWSIFDEDAHAGTSLPQKTTSRYLPGNSFHIPIPASAFFKSKIATFYLFSFVKLIYPQQLIRIKLLPENQNYLFRLKPF